MNYSKRTCLFLDCEPCLVTEARAGTSVILPLSDSMKILLHLKRTSCTSQWPCQSLLHIICVFHTVSCRPQEGGAILDSNLKSFDREFSDNRDTWVVMLQSNGISRRPWFCRAMKQLQFYSFRFRPTCTCTGLGWIGGYMVRKSSFPHRYHFWLRQDTAEQSMARNLYNTCRIADAYILSNSALPHDIHAIATGDVGMYAIMHRAVTSGMRSVCAVIVASSNWIQIEMSSGRGYDGTLVHNIVLYAS